MFTKEKRELSKLKAMDFKQISMDNNEALIASFFQNEIKEAIWGCDSLKALGPDGFNFGFVKSQWEIIKEDVIEFLQDF
ncbi:hypothetical protein SLA2020_524810 [Shorea laevis]